jgi:predicted nucleotidyltransferase
MRLTPDQISTIKETVAEIFGADAEIRLFGSRLDNQATGGDIDLLIELPQPCPDRVARELRLSARLELRLGEQSIDILVIDPAVHRNPVHERALATGRVL